MTSERASRENENFEHPQGLGTLQTPVGGPWDPSNIRRGNHRANCELSKRF